MATQPLLYTLHIQLEPLNFNPPVWRRLRVNGDCTLRKLHHFIQAAFGCKRTGITPCRRIPSCAAAA
ncbi:plasmid pRiA4b ORF-3 family protein, partial [Pseudomonas aeruginosa]|uniref:plasmid pRiA4b ORF-3 family protein n=1 Tax=Pseudomonas aeruginosa TaxID=287 RepID=UPI001E431C00